MNNFKQYKIVWFKIVFKQQLDASQYSVTLLLLVPEVLMQETVINFSYHVRCYFPRCIVVGSESMLGSAHCWHGDATTAPKTLKHQLGRAVTSGGANTFTDVINKLNEAKLSGKVTMVTSIDSCEVDDDVIVDVVCFCFYSINLLLTVLI